MSASFKHLRLVSPSQSYAFKDPEKAEVLREQVQEALGVALSWGSASKPALGVDSFSPTSECFSPQARLDELEAAFNDPMVDGLWCTRGGSAQADLLRLLATYTPSHPKPILGMSDNTLILAWLKSKTGVSGFYAPVFNDLARQPGDSTLKSLKNILSGNKDWALGGSMKFKDFIDEPEKGWQTGKGAWVVQEGAANGETLVGHIGRLLSAATMGYGFSLKNRILLLETLSTNPERFSNELEFLLNLPGGDEVAGLGLGRFVASSGITPEILAKIIANKEELHGKPVVAGLDFGHTYPILSLPFVGKVSMLAKMGNINISGTIL